VISKMRVYVQRFCPTRVRFESKSRMGDSGSLKLTEASHTGRRSLPMPLHLNHALDRQRVSVNS
jgi:hypothetical protein